MGFQKVVEITLLWLLNVLLLNGFRLLDLQDSSNGNV